MQALLRTFRLDSTRAKCIASSIELADDVAAEVEHALARLAPTEDYFAVRSSALEEDSPGRSFGQLDDALFVARAEVPAKIAEATGASGFNERLSCYRREAGLGLLTEAPAVIVQRMIGGDVSGVAFSADPVSGRRAISVVSAVPGSGGVPWSRSAAVADTWRVELGGKIVERSVESKIVMHLADAAAPDGIRTVPVYRLSAPQRPRQLMRRCARSPVPCAKPKRTSWSAAGHRGGYPARHRIILSLQSRPITALAERFDPDARSALGENANIIESYSGITTPLTFFIRAARIRKRLSRVLPVAARPGRYDRGTPLEHVLLHGSG